jgi:hypothetical protein
MLILLIVVLLVLTCVASCDGARGGTVQARASPEEQLHGVYGM